MKAVAVFLLMVVLSLLIPRPLSAHPSASDTLTIDLLVGSDGLAAIDAAVVESEGPTYRPFPTTEQKRDVAIDVVDAFGLTDDDVNLDPEMSERYHQVGFYITLPPDSPHRLSSLSFDTARLQEITSELGLGYLRLSLCTTVLEGASTSVYRDEIFDEMGMTASQPGQHSSDPNQRPGCRLWLLEPEDPGVSINLPAPELPYTGANLLPIVAAVTMGIGLGVLILGTTRSRERKTHSD